MRHASFAIVCSLTLAACDSTDSVEDQPFEGEWSGQCDMNYGDGVFGTFAFDLVATYDEASGTVEGTATTTNDQSETLDGEIEGSVSGASVDLTIAGDGKVGSGDYSFYMELAGEWVDDRIEGTCTDGSGDTGTLSMSQ